MAMKEVTSVYLTDVISGEPIEIGDIEGNVLIAFDIEAAMPDALGSASSTSLSSATE